MVSVDVRAVSLSTVPATAQMDDESKPYKSNRNRVCRTCETVSESIHRSRVRADGRYGRLNSDRRPQIRTTKAREVVFSEGRGSGPGFMGNRVRNKSPLPKAAKHGGKVNLWKNSDVTAT
ncbi:hypothetical protein PoB_002247200 [Plakobranchus ocellatus]|uniref:Uncharacterized protein n=1 Tax=Plakobranchus ocellatus TaxID=259542 RepID=A0AAV3ZMS7_9GAST|nr:hypothetical protein PoB_002247200 [Plakobranchus ocellatus]